LLKLWKIKNKLAVFLFLDLSTGRVERFLINTSDDTDKLSTSINNDTFFFQGKEYIINISDEQLATQEQFDSFSFEHEFMSDGKLSGKFFNNFLWNLLRDYLANLIGFDRHISYLNPNMNLLRKLTLPLDWSDVRKISDIKIGSGIIPSHIEPIINKDKKYKLKDIDMINAPVFIKRNKEFKNLIYIPKSFTNLTSIKQFDSKLLEIRRLDKKDYPQLILDLKSTLMFRSIKKWTWFNKKN